MKVGTKSVLFGIHHWWWHFYFCVRAWRWLYGRWPRLSEGVAIFLHDFGLIGCDSLTSSDASNHPLRVQSLVHVLAGYRAGHLVLQHSRGCCSQWGMSPSMLCWAGLLAEALWLEESPQTFLNRAGRSGELEEFREISHATRVWPLASTDTDWAKDLAEFLRSEAILGARSALLSTEARQARLKLELELERGAV